MADLQLASLIPFAEQVTSRVAQAISPNAPYKGPPRPKDDPTRRILLSGGLLELLREALLFEGYRLEQAKVQAFREPPLDYHRILSPKGHYLALLQVDAEHLEDPNRLTYRFGLFFSGVAKGLFVFADAAIDAETDAILQQAADYWESASGFEKAKFFSPARVKLLEQAAMPERASSLQQMLGLAAGGGAAGSKSFQDQQAVSMFARLALAGPLPAKEYFRDLVKQLPAGGAQVADVWTGDAEADARKLLLWAGEMPTYPPGNAKQGYSPLGCLFEIVVTQMGSGPDQRYLQELMVKLKLAPDEVLARLRQEFGLRI